MTIYESDIDEDLQQAARSGLPLGAGPGTAQMVCPLTRTLSVEEVPPLNGDLNKYLFHPLHGKI